MNGQDIAMTCTVCPTCYRTWHFFNNSKFEQEYVRCVRNEEECVCSVPNCCDTEQRVRQPGSQPVIKKMPGSVASGTLCIYSSIPGTVLLYTGFPCFVLCHM